VFRGLVDVLVHRLVPSPSLYGAGEAERAADVVNRRRAWFWRTWLRRFLWLVAILFALLVATNLVMKLFGTNVPLGDTLNQVGDFLSQAAPSMIFLVLQLPLLFLINFGILFGPLLFFGIKQMKAYEPGDADWGVKLADVRGQREPKEEVTRVISLWQSSEDFKQAGGKPERGLLFIGAPGTGKTMLSKGIATSFNCPFMTMPGSGFAQTFIGMDVVIVMILVGRARRLARKWGGQCIIFIDEIDAVGMRRQALQGAGGMATPVYESGSIHDFLFYGPSGALTPTGDLLLETRAWREKVFAARAEPPRALYPPAFERVAGAINSFILPGGMGGQGGGLALNQLLVQMDGVDDPPFMRRFATKFLNTLLDASYFVPQKVGSVKLRIRPPRPRTEQIYFIGATNVPIEVLDPALIRPGRMGRHIHFRTPTKDDRKDIFDLYLAKVDHEDDLDSDRRRDELARITNGYSPAMIEQVCSMALTLAHSDRRQAFGWHDLVEAMTTVETGFAIGVNYIPEETRAVAIHEAGHAVAGHVFMKDSLSTRLSIRMRAGSLGHHQAIEKDERFSAWRSEQVARLIWTLGAMAAEEVFYGENSTGVGGDVQSATRLACAMVGMWAMGPETPALPAPDGPADGDSEEQEARDRVDERFERIGMQIMNRAAGGGGMMGEDPLAKVLQDPSKRIAVARLLGQAYVTAYQTIAQNREKVERIAEVLIEKREIHGDEVVDLLDREKLHEPTIDLLAEATWPKT